MLNISNYYLVFVALKASGGLNCVVVWEFKEGAQGVGEYWCAKCGVASLSRVCVVHHTHIRSGTLATWSCIAPRCGCEVMFQT